MRDEHVPQAIECDAGIDHLPRDTITTIDQIRNIVNQEERREDAAANRAERWSAFRAQQNNSRCVLG